MTNLQISERLERIDASQNVSGESMRQRVEAAKRIAALDFPLAEFAADRFSEIWNLFFADLGESFRPILADVINGSDVVRNRYADPNLIIELPWNVVDTLVQSLTAMIHEQVEPVFAEPVDSALARLEGRSVPKRPQPAPPKEEPVRRREEPVRRREESVRRREESVRRRMTPPEPRREGWGERFFSRFRSQRTIKLDPRYLDPMSELPRPKNSTEEKLLYAFEPVGAIRRREEKIPCVEILFASNNSTALFDRLESLGPVKKTIRRGVRRVMFEISRAVNRLGDPIVCHFLAEAVSPESFPTALLCRSSAPAHWEELCKRANGKGLILDETGLFENYRRLPVVSEDEIYRRLGLPFIPPERRDGRDEFRQSTEAPEILVERSDLRGDMHLHTTYSDGIASIEQMTAAAMDAGLDYIALTDHSQRVYSAGGMDARKIKLYWKRIDRINQQLKKSGKSFRIFKGVEVDILSDGQLDLSDDILSQADWVVASIHFDMNQPKSQIHHRIISALSNPYVCVLGHPTGRVFASGFHLNLDADFLVEAARAFGKYLEINSQPRRLDPNVEICRKAKAAGVKMVISTDSHAPNQYEYLRYGVYLARRAALGPDDILNTLSADEMAARRVAILERHEWSLFDKLKPHSPVDQTMSRPPES